jgi:hypothetical protein
MAQEINTDHPTGGHVDLDSNVDQELQEVHRLLHPHMDMRIPILPLPEVENGTGATCDSRIVHKSEIIPEIKIGAGADELDRDQFRYTYIR